MIKSESSTIKGKKGKTQPVYKWYAVEQTQPRKPKQTKKSSGRKIAAHRKPKPKQSARKKTPQSSWSATEIRLLRKLYKQGKSDEQIARVFAKDKYCASRTVSSVRGRRYVERLLRKSQPRTTLEPKVVKTQTEKVRESHPCPYCGKVFDTLRARCGHENFCPVKKESETTEKPETVDTIVLTEPQTVGSLIQLAIEDAVSQATEGIVNQKSDERRMQVMERRIKTLQMNLGKLDKVVRKSIKTGNENLRVVENRLTVIEETLAGMEDTDDNSDLRNLVQRMSDFTSEMEDRLNE
jgi:hypothetical protein